MIVQSLTENAVEVYIAKYLDRIGDLSLFKGDRTGTMGKSPSVEKF